MFIEKEIATEYTLNWTPNEISRFFGGYISFNLRLGYTILYFHSESRSGAVCMAAPIEASLNTRLQ